VSINILSITVLDLFLIQDTYLALWIYLPLKKSSFLVTGGFLDLLISLIILVFVVLQTSSVTCKFLDIEGASDGLKKTQTITAIFLMQKIRELITKTVPDYFLAPNRAIRRLQVCECW